ncbi:cyclohexanecarboxylate-CoA ligase [Arthrobacter sp. UCD-GKA]|uniref:AMP-binding protein n=1 Tax=Arthrobacter sp. UCD-GKA TaxID=1913576 RepID=UPI0008DE68AC|nr:AMP-binding protein [Arthrobacter sp. UCD-GKA]OIH85464.1 cyclohexanecarboxylate-CoA ligase [Arthrobacter sp. UCD-GKA]
MAFATVLDRYTQRDIDGFYRDGLWDRLTMFGELEKQNRIRPEKVFISDSTKTFTFAEVHEIAVRLAAGLHRQGIGAGDSVAVQIPSWAEFAAISMAINRLGAIIVPVQPIYRTGEVSHILRTAEVKAVFTVEEYRKFNHVEMFLAQRGESETLETVITVRAEKPHAGALSYDELLVPGPLANLEAEIGSGLGPDDAFAIVFSSGTTSKAKGCLHSFNTLACSARIQGEEYNYSDADVQFGPSPVTHTTGLVTSLILPLIFGAATHIMERWDPEEGLRAIEKYKCTGTINASTFLQTVLGAFDPLRHDASSMRFWTLAGAPIPAPLVEAAREAFPQMKIISLYGRTENVTTTMCHIDDDPLRAVTSDGKALRGQEVRIIDFEGHEVPLGEEGDIAYNGSMHLFEYIGMPEEERAMFTEDGFSRSGDLGRMDEDGYVRVTGRLKDIVIRGGMNISVREVEDLLAGHPGVDQVAVVAMPDPTMGERACCYLTLQDEGNRLSLEEIKGYLLDKGLAIQKVPERLEILDEMPSTPTGKIQKNVLRERIAERLLASAEK